MAPPAAPATGLIVPIRVEALRIGARDALKAPAFNPRYADFTRIPWKSGLKHPYLGRYLLNAPFTGHGPLEQGIHLHWHLPRGLKQGESDKDGVLKMPAVPNRWLVTRIAVNLKTPQAPVTTLKSWVVESDYLATQSTYSDTSVPYAAESRNAQPYRYMGRVYDLSDWLVNGGSGAYAKDLTAVGFGIPDFSSYYPNCRNVFGLLDRTLNNPKADYGSSIFAYAVTGWYSDPANDPCNGGTLAGSGNRYGWLFPNGGPRPGYSLFAGATHDLTWDSNPNKAYLPNWQTPIAPDVAIGNTPMEAISAWAASALETEELSQVERLLNALQLGSLNALNSPGGLARIEEELFDRSFTSADGGRLWDIVPLKSATAESRKRPAGVDGALPLLHQLAALNDLQQRANSLNAQASALQTQIFCDWNKYMVVRYPVGTPEKIDISTLMAYLRHELGALAGLRSAIQDLDARIEQGADTLRAIVPPDMELTTVPAPRWYAPNDPVVLLTGDHVPAPQPDTAKAIHCLTTDQLCTALELPEGLVAGSASCRIGIDLLPAIAVADAVRLPYPAAALLTPVVALIAPSIAAVPTSALLGVGGNGNPAVLNYAATRAAIEAAQRALLAEDTPANGIALAGALLDPPIALPPWDAPWNPIALSWEASYQPVVRTGTGGTYQGDFVTTNFTLEVETMDMNVDPSARFSQDSQIYNGTILLSSDAMISMRTEIARYIPYADASFRPELEEILAELGAKPILVQSLGGFHEALGMLSETMQLPVKDPLAADPGSAAFTQAVATAVAQRNSTAPLPDFAYNPLRAGKMRLAQLELIDSFGQFRTVNLSGLAVSETIPVIDDNGPALLPPLRVPQDSRLDFTLLAAADPAVAMSSLPVSSPICGWVVPNTLDRGLMFYGEDGTAIGTLTATDGGTVWQDAPDAGPASQSIEDAFRGRNAVLSGFALAVDKGGAEYLNSLLDQFARTRTNIAPAAYQQDRQTAVLLGTPMAIVQAGLGIDLMGLPWPDQSYKALQTDMQRPFPVDGPPTRTTNGFTDVAVPVTLGSLSELDDGLYGYFLQDKTTGEPDFSDFHPVESNSAIPLAFSATGPSVVTMLVDPRSPVHAFCGIAPVTTAVIPQDFYATALDALTFVFLCSPVLTLPSGVALPLPTEADGGWSWVEYAEGGWITEEIGAVDDRATMQAPGRISEGWLKLTGKGGNT